MAELYTFFTSFSFKCQGDMEIKESTRTHNSEGNLTGSLETHWIQTIFVVTNLFLLFIPHSPCRLDLAKLVMERSETTSPLNSTNIELSKTKTIELSRIQELEIKASWPPKPCELSETTVTIPDNLKEFVFTVLPGSTGFSCLQSCSQNGRRLITSFGQDFLFGVSGGRQKPPNHVLLPYAVKSYTNNAEPIQISKCCDHGIAYQLPT